MNDQKPTSWTKEQIIAGIQECAAKLGKVPTQDELRREKGIPQKTFTRFFGNFTKALLAAGLEGRGSGFMLSMEELFMEWARIVRKIGAVPSASEYVLHSSHSLTPLRKRFRYLNDVPAGMVQYAVENGHEEQWRDVLEIARKYRREARTGGWRDKPKALSSNPRVLKDRPVCGAPLIGSAIAFAPVNEMGVVYLFGTMASRLGFLLTYIGTQYPDGQAYREVEPGRWQFVRIEFEFQSRNFLQHFHDPEECDLIVCWEHNWGEAPVEVLELKQALSNQQSAKPGLF
jgi:Homing endonuclease associated repeat